MQNKISIILPLRGQYNVFKNLMQSLVDTTAHPKDIEILVAIDDDDNNTMLFGIDCVEEYPTFNMRFITTKRSINFSRDYYNFLAKMANGRWILGANADCYYRTKGWDIIIDKKMSDAAKKFGDDIIVGIVDDCLLEKDHSINFASWILTSKEYIDLMGGILNDRIPCWGADVAFGKVFNLVDNGKRKIDIKEVVIDHMNNHIYKEIPVTMHTTMFHKIVAKYPTFLTEKQLKKDADKINKYIKK